MRRWRGLVSVAVLELVGGAPAGLGEIRDGAGRKATAEAPEPYGTSGEHLVEVAAGATPEPRRGAGEPQLQGS